MNATDPIAEIRRLCAEGTEGHGDEFYGPIEHQLTLLVDADSTFRHGITTAVQIMVDDIGQLVHRRNNANARDDVTGAMVGVAKRLALLPMPTRVDDAPFTRGSVLIDISPVGEAGVERAARALLDSERRIHDQIVQSIPEEGRQTFLVINPPLPEWDGIDDVSQERFRLRARHALAAALLPI